MQHPSKRMQIKGEKQIHTNREDCRSERNFRENQNIIEIIEVLMLYLIYHFFL